MSSCWNPGCGGRQFGPLMGVSPSQWRDCLGSNFLFMFLIVPSETLKDKDDESRKRHKNISLSKLPCHCLADFSLVPKPFYTSEILYQCLMQGKNKVYPDSGSTYLDQWVNPLLCAARHEKVSLLSCTFLSISHYCCCSRAEWRFELHLSHLLLQGCKLV